MKPILEQPRQLCALGAQQTVVAIERAIPILHAGPGCGYKLHCGLGTFNGFQGGGYSGGGSGSSARPRWSPSGSSVVYTPAEVRALTPIRETVEKRVLVPESRDVFLCHAWDDRGGPAKELHDLLEARGVSVWFSEKDIILGMPLMREIDKAPRLVHMFGAFGWIRFMHLRRCAQVGDFESSCGEIPQRAG